ncbi:nuclear transport factor 2 family protein [Herbaspirillum sp. HC18]|nr:nuclear transport factor 2 family protein [Herbaspirillum sp. HC18]
MLHRTENPGRKDAAVSFLHLASAGKAREAFDKYAGPGFIHHNPYFKGDADSLVKGMEENAARFPGKKLEVQRALEDGGLVAVHSHVRLKPEDLGVALVHIFRFEGERIVELWDMGQPVPEDCVNEHGMF